MLSADCGIQPILNEMKKISAELQDIRISIAGKAVKKLINEIFPIKSEANLANIQYNMENTDNFGIRLVNKTK